MASFLYLTILTDLGQLVLSNIFTSPQQMMYAINQPDRLVTTIAEKYGLTYNSGRISDWNGDDNDSRPPAQPGELFAWLGWGQPSAHPAAIGTQYLCQIPKLKSTGSLLVSVIVADLVLLQVLWLVLNWVVTLILQRRNQTARHCAGCVEAQVNPSTNNPGPESDTIVPASGTMIPCKPDSRESYELVPTYNDAPMLPPPNFRAGPSHGFSRSSSSNRPVSDSISLERLLPSEEGDSGTRREGQEVGGH